MIDFTKCPTKNKSYNGANGKKIAVEYDGSLYMLKFPTVGKINTDIVAGKLSGPHILWFIIYVL